MSSIVTAPPIAQSGAIMQRETSGESTIGAALARWLDRSDSVMKVSTASRAARPRLAALLLLGALTLVPANAHASAAATAGLQFPSSMTVGDTGLSAGIAMGNANTDPDQSVENTVSRIELVPSCKVPVAGGCAQSGADPGVFKVSPTAVGSGACAGTSFGTAVTDASLGTVTFTPLGGAPVRLPGGSTCGIAFTLDVLKAPADSNPSLPGDQTWAGSSNSQCMTMPPFLCAAGSSSSGSTVKPAYPTSCESAGAIVGTAGDDTLVGTPGRDYICGLGGNDVLTGYQGNDILDGGAGNDTLRGAADNDILLGGAGNDTLFPGAGMDVLQGGDGIDLADYSYFVDVSVSLNDVANDGYAGKNDNVKTDVENVLGGAGNDTLTGSPQANTLTGGAGDDLLIGYQGNDVLHGGDGNDTLRGAADNDIMFGGAGDDTLFPGDGTDDLSGGAGTDTADYSYFEDVWVSLDGVADDGPRGKGDNVRADVENILGGPGNDVLYGSPEANVLTGNGGNDHLIGQAGADILNGGDGNDSLFGLTGADVFSGGNGDDALDAYDGATTDRISCGAGRDVVQPDLGEPIDADCEVRS